MKNEVDFIPLISYFLKGSKHSLEDVYRRAALLCLFEAFLFVGGSPNTRLGMLLSVVDRFDQTAMPLVVHHAMPGPYSSPSMVVFLRKSLLL